MNNSSFKFFLYKGLCLIFLAIFFFSTYGIANWYASTLVHVPEIVFKWEKHIPFIPWSIIPYWSIDLFYGLSVLMCQNYRILSTHIKRLCTAQVICVICFFLYPLQFSIQRPEISGFFRLMYDALMGFDKPFNQAPSLHIVLLIILWVFYAQRTSHILGFIVHIWSLAIGLSVLTTWQHHFIDIPLGICVAAYCLWLWPDQNDQKMFKLTTDHNRKKVAAYYGLGGLVLGLIAIYYKSYALWLLWPMVSLLMISVIYLFLGASGFQKNSHGHMSVGASILLTPYFVFAYINSRVWTWKNPKPSLITIEEGILPNHVQLYLGRISSGETLTRFDALLDVCAELPVCIPVHCRYKLIPILDLSIPNLSQLEQGAESLEHLIYSVEPSQLTSSRILVSCALGYSRSACIFAAWLIRYGHVKTAQDAIDIIQDSRSCIVLGQKHLNQLEKLAYRVNDNEYS